MELFIFLLVVLRVVLSTRGRRATNRFLSGIIADKVKARAHLRQDQPRQLLVAVGVLGPVGLEQFLARELHQRGAPAHCDDTVEKQLERQRAIRCVHRKLEQAHVILGLSLRLTRLMNHELAVPLPPHSQ